MKPYDPADWLLISRKAPSDRLIAAMEQVFGANDPRAGAYANTAALNELLTWSPLENPDPLKVFVLRFGIGRGEASTPHTLKRAAEIVGRPAGSMQEANPPRLLRIAHTFHRRVPPGHGLNELRAMGLSPKIWTHLAYEGILTLDQLCDKSEAELYDIRHIGQGSCDTIVRLLPSGRSLRSS